VASASIFGVPIVIDENGFSVSGNNGGNGKSAQDLIAQLNNAMHVQDFTMRMFPATPLQKNGSEVSVGSGGIEFSYRTDAVHYDGRIGYTQASVVAVPKPDVAAAPSTAAAEPAVPGNQLSVPAANDDAAAPVTSVTDTSATNGTVALSARLPTVNVQVLGDQHKLTRLQTMVYAKPPANRVAELYIALGCFFGLIALLCCLRSVNVAGRVIGAAAAFRRGLGR
jgi:hypothetical protein